MPFKDNSVSEVLCFHVLEHVNNFVPLIHELHRICKKDAIIYVTTPFFSTWGQYNDPTHVRFFTPYTFRYFNKGSHSHEVGSDKDMFDVNVKLIFGIGISSKLNWLINPIVNLSHRFYCRFFAWILPCAEIRYKIKVLK